MTTPRYGIGILGTGIMGRRMLGALLQHPRLHVVALWDPQAAALAKAAQLAPNARCATGMVDLVSDPAIDVIYIASPPTQHRQGVEAAISAGRACLCEKPLAANRIEADSLRKLVADSGLPFAVNFPFARSPACRQLIDLVHGGKLGKIESATITLRFAKWPREWQAGASDWLAGPAEGGFTREVLSHFVFLSQRLFGEAEVTDVHLVREPGESETALRARLVHEQVSVFIDAAVAGEIADQNRFEVVGRDATVALNDWARLEYDGQISDRVDSTPATLDGLAEMLDARSGHGLASVEEAASVVRCVESILALPS